MQRVTETLHATEARLDARAAVLELRVFEHDIEPGIGILRHQRYAGAG